ncbi:MAG: SDR family NAD(P)-dependent oxidoreductase [Candidatus Hodarchaeales archaeon]|jgi:NAD(P)-dependent dehydrogenase (short-subunit alcohol dehydrogenase family)
MTIPDLRQEDKVVIITGSRRGIGKAMALAFAEAGAHIVISDRIVDDGALKSLAKEIKTKFGIRVLTSQTDVTKINQIEHMVQTTLDELGRIDVLINNAGIVGTAPLLIDFNEKDFDLVFDVAIKGSLRCAKVVSKAMIRQNCGCIINMSSIGAYINLQSAYSLAKSTLIKITRGLATQLGPFNIRVNAIAPGVIKTDMTKLIFDYPKIHQFYVDRTPLGRTGIPNDIAHVALFLASEASRFITGQTILVDGGLGPMELPGTIPFSKNAESIKKSLLKD